jgi:hypothetical protein
MAASLGQGSMEHPQGDGVGNRRVTGAPRLSDFADTTRGIHCDFSQANAAVRRQPWSTETYCMPICRSCNAEVPRWSSVCRECGSIAQIAISGGAAVPVTVPVSRRVAFPDVCCCCLGSAEKRVRVTGEKVTYGIASMYIKTRSIEVPYCRTCEAHHWIKSAYDTFTLLLFIPWIAAIYGSYMLLNGKLGGVWAVLVGIAATTPLFLGLDHYVQRVYAAKNLGKRHSAVGRAAGIGDFRDDNVVFWFSSEEYASRFAQLNGGELIHGSSARHRHPDFVVDPSGNVRPCAANQGSATR